MRRSVMYVAYGVVLFILIASIVAALRGSSTSKVVTSPPQSGSQKVQTIKTGFARPGSGDIAVTSGTAIELSNPGTSKPAGRTVKQLANTGPGSTFAVFVGAVGAGYVAYTVHLRRRLNASV